MYPNNMIEKFYDLNKKEIVALLQNFMEKDFYPRFPELKNNISVVATGSVATENYDKYSDVDLAIIFQSPEEAKNYLPKIKEYKKHIREIKEPIQVHTPTTYEEIKSDLMTWQQDNLLREYSQAVIVDDPDNKFFEIQQKFLYYPEEVYQEKISWLFAETVFQIKERLEISVARKDIYFSQVVKMQIVRLFLNTLLLLNKKWPAFDKHLYQDARKMTKQYDISIAEKLIAEQEIENLLPLVNQIKAQLEKLLLEAGLIKHETEQYWIDLRPKYQIKLG